LNIRIALPPWLLPLGWCSSGETLDALCKYTIFYLKWQDVFSGFRLTFASVPRFPRSASATRLMFKRFLRFLTDPLFRHHRKPLFSLHGQAFLPLFAQAPYQKP
jgi:hypothetical protein